MGAQRCVSKVFGCVSQLRPASAVDLRPQGQALALVLSMWVGEAQMVTVGSVLFFRLCEGLKENANPSRPKTETRNTQTKKKNTHTQQNPQKTSRNTSETHQKKDLQQLKKRPKPIQTPKRQEHPSQGEKKYTPSTYKNTFFNLLKPYKSMKKENP